MITAVVKFEICNTFPQWENLFIIINQWESCTNFSRFSLACS